MSAIEMGLTGKITDSIKKYFTENPNEQVFVGTFEAEGNPKTLAAGVTVAKSLGKAVYIASVDHSSDKVAHVNYVPKHVLDSKVLTAKTWLAEVSTVLGGKGGGKDESATGVGSNTKETEAGLELAKKFYVSKVEGL